MTAPAKTIFPPEAAERHRQVLAALRTVVDNQVKCATLLEELLTDARRPIDEDDSLSRLEGLLERTCDLLGRALGD